jgi:hypothetical protein
MKKLHRPLTWLVIGTVAITTLAFPLQSSATPQQWELTRHELGDPDTPPGGSPARVSFLGLRLVLLRGPLILILPASPASKSIEGPIRVERARGGLGR